MFDPYAAVLGGDPKDGAAPAESSDVRQLPPPPGGSTLLLSGLLTLGSLRLARSAKDIHLAALPAWYHEACPERINHAVAFDFEFTDLPVCFVADIAAANAADHPPGIHEYLRESRSRIEYQFILPVIAPRGPPTIA